MVLNLYFKPCLCWFETVTETILLSRDIRCKIICFCRCPPTSLWIFNCAQNSNRAVELHQTIHTALILNDMYYLKISITKLQWLVNIGIPPFKNSKMHLKNLPWLLQSLGQWHHFRRWEDLSWSVTWKHHHEDLLVGPRDRVQVQVKILSSQVHWSEATISLFLGWWKTNWQTRWPPIWPSWLRQTLGCLTSGKSHITHTTPCICCHTQVCPVYGESHTTLNTPCTSLYTRLIDCWPI